MRLNALIGEKVNNNRQYRQSVANAVDDKNLVSKKELDFLTQNIDDLYQIYICTYGNITSNMCCSNGPILHGMPQPDDDYGVGNIAMALAIRGARNNWTLMDKKDFVNRVHGLLTGKSS